MKSIGTLEYTTPFQEAVHCLGQFLLKVLGDDSAEHVASCLKIGQGLEDSDAGWVEHLHTLITQLQDVSERCRTSGAQSNLKTSNTLPQQDESKSQRQKKEDHRLVQITADEAEVRRRIAGFINSKREDVNEANIREFCFGLPDSDSQNRCARVDAVFVSHTGNTTTKSRVNVKRIFNMHGPQTHSFTTSQWSRHRSGTDGDAETCALAAIEERLANAEGHLHLGPETKARVFERLQALEERILFLEGLSPEYFQDSFIPPPKRRKVDAPSPVKVFEPDEKTGYEGILELDQQIFALEQKLKEKMKAEHSQEKIITDCT